MKSDKIDEYISNHIGEYWDSTEDLAKALKEKFGDIFSDDEWFAIAMDGIDRHYS